MPKILLVEDEHLTATIVVDWLTAEGHTVDLVTDGVDGYDWLRNASYDVAIIDWGLPRLSGVELCEKYRRSGGQTPILMLTGKKAVNEKTHGLDSGADDYLTKPFELEELSARVRALLRRKPNYSSTILCVNDIELDPISKMVKKDGIEIHLLPKEFAILHLLMRHPNQVFSADAILERVWSTDTESATDTVRPYITKLRKKLSTADEDDSIIQTVYGSGYKLVTD